MFCFTTNICFIYSELLILNSCDFSKFSRFIDYDKLEDDDDEYTQFDMKIINFSIWIMVLIRSENH